MLAPQTIQVRYGPSGLLAAGLLAQLKGGGQGDSRAADQAFIADRLNYARSQEQAANAMDANRLQMAQQAYSPRAAMSPAPDYGGNDAAVNQAYLTGAAGDLSPESQAQLAQLAVRPGVKADAFGRLVGSSVSNNQKRKADADTQKGLDQKREYLKSAAAGLDPTDLQNLAAAVEDPKFSITQLNMAVSGLQRARQAREQAQQKEQTKAANTERNIGSKAAVAQIDEEMQLAARQLAGIKKELVAAGLNPDSMRPAEFNPTYDKAPTQLSVGNVLGSILKHGEYGMETGQGNVGARPTYMAYQKLDAKLRALAAKKAEAIRTGGGVPFSTPEDQGQMQEPTPGFGQGKPITQDVAIQFYQAAGGDPTVARQMAIDQGYQP